MRFWYRIEYYHSITYRRQDDWISGHFDHSSYCIRATKTLFGLVFVKVNKCNTRHMMHWGIICHIEPFRQIFCYTIISHETRYETWAFWIFLFLTIRHLKKKVKWMSRKISHRKENEKENKTPKYSILQNAKKISLHRLLVLDTHHSK